MPTSARPGFFPHSRQGTRALPYKALRYRARADRGVRSYGGDKGCGEGGTMWASSPTEELHGVRYKSGRRAEGSPPYKFDFVRRDGRGRTPPLRRGQEVRGKRDDVGIVPYGGVTRSAVVGRRPQGAPLRNGL